MTEIFGFIQNRCGLGSFYSFKGSFPRGLNLYFNFSFQIPQRDLAGCDTWAGRFKTWRFDRNEIILQVTSCTCLLKLLGVLMCLNTAYLLHMLIPSSNVTLVPPHETQRAFRRHVTVHKLPLLPDGWEQHQRELFKNRCDWFSRIWSLTISQKLLDLQASSWKDVWDQSVKACRTKILSSPVSKCSNSTLKCSCFWTGPNCS